MGLLSERAFLNRRKAEKQREFLNSPIVDNTFREADETNNKSVWNSFLDTFAENGNKAEQGMVPQIDNKLYKHREVKIYYDPITKTTCTIHDGRINVHEPLSIATENFNPDDPNLGIGAGALYNPFGGRIRYQSCTDPNGQPLNQGFEIDVGTGGKLEMGGQIPFNPAAMAGTAVKNSQLAEFGMGGFPLEIIQQGLAEPAVPFESLPKNCKIFGGVNADVNIGFKGSGNIDYKALKEGRFKDYLSLYGKPGVFVDGNAELSLSCDDTNPGSTVGLRRKIYKNR